MKNITLLLEKIQALKSKEPKLRNRDLAQRLGISEAELLSLYAGQNVTILNGSWKNLISQLHQMGNVMALTRNEHCVHERKGIYKNIEFYDGPHNMGVAVNPDIDLRFFMNEWHYGFAVIMDRPKGKKLYSFQFFNKKGEAVHKVFSTPKSNIKAYHVIVEVFRAKKQTPINPTDKTPYCRKVEEPDNSIDISGFQQAWLNLKDTHHFFGLLRKFGVSRTQALRLAPEGYTTELDKEAVIRMLQLTAERNVPIMCFLHSRGCVQIHTGSIKNLKVFGDWYNILDPKFNLHLKMPSIKQAYIVRKPTEDGIVSSLELFDETGDLIVYFFGARKPGIPELEEWKTILLEVQPNATSIA